MIMFRPAIFRLSFSRVKIFVLHFSSNIFSSHIYFVTFFFLVRPWFLSFTHFFRLVNFSFMHFFVNVCFRPFFVQIFFTLVFVRLLHILVQISAD